MVPDSGAAARADQLRPLNRPRPLTVVTRAGEPAILVEGERRRRIVAIEDRWRIDDEWWRDPISRTYYRVLLDDGSARTLYHDLVADAWYGQAY